MNGHHYYNLTVEWTGNTGTGTAAYKSYERNHSIYSEGKPEISGSSDPAFRGDRTRYNPEELLLASLSGCHMLQYLHLCTTAGVIVTAYTDHASGVMVETADGGGHFTEVTLNPIVTVINREMIEMANHLHAKANALCFIAASVNFPVHHRPVCQAEPIA